MSDTVKGSLKELKALKARSKAKSDRLNLPYLFIGWLPRYRRMMLVRDAYFYRYVKVAEAVRFMQASPYGTLQELYTNLLDICDGQRGIELSGSSPRDEAAQKNHEALVNMVFTLRWVARLINVKLVG